MNDDFDIFEKALNEINKPIEKKNIKPNNNCEHTNLSLENGINICTDCGKEITRDIKHNKEWRYYGSSDTKYSSDPNRCHIRKEFERSIYKDVTKMGFSNKIVNEANKIYNTVTNGKIYRGNSRKAIIFACIFHAYKLSGNPQSCEQLIKIFNLDRKIGLKGLKHVNLNAPRNSTVRTTYITPQHLIEEIMNKFNATDSQKKDVLLLYDKIKNKSSILNRSRPQSVASGLVKYYINITGKDISMNDFKEKVKLSELTINRIVKEIEKILDKKKE